MSMISSALITGGVFNQSVQVDQRQIYTQKSAIDRLQEAVAHKAFHNSGKQYDRPKCHPKTRIAVRDKIDKWAMRTDPETRDASILWLSGAAGAGKSAIAQSMAEDFHSRGLLIASFFFGRTDPTRNHAQSLVSTIVYQLYSLLPPPEQSRILAVIERDPLIFTKSLLAQFEALIVIPLQPLLQNGFWSGIDTPRIIIIDGLDECLDHGMQCEVLHMLSASVHQFHLPFVFLLASRPEHDIKAIFSSPNFLHTRLFLDDSYLPDRDIEVFLRDQFEECRTAHPFKHLIPPNWPSDDVVRQIISKSSGQFIYASVVAKYIKSSRHRPDHRLDIVLNLRPASKDLPFSELDALYTHIFSCVADIERVLNIISFHIPSLTIPSAVVVLELILQLDAGEVGVLLCDLLSVISYDEGFGKSNPNFGLEHQSIKYMYLKISHASLVDYLLDNSRSKEYFIHLDKHRSNHVSNCFRLLSHTERQDAFHSAAVGAMAYFVQHHDSLELTEPLYDAMRQFSVSRMYALSLNTTAFKYAAFNFLPALFDFLQKLDSDKHLELYQHHKSEYDFCLQESMTKNMSKDPIPLFLALVAVLCKTRVPEIGAAEFVHRFSFFDVGHLDAQALAIFQLDSFFDTYPNEGYLAYLSAFLWDPKRSGEFCAGPKLFAHAAKYCLLYLCDHGASAQKAPARMSMGQRIRRINTPWKWHRRVLREDIRGPPNTPWLWLRYSETTYNLSYADILRLDKRIVLRRTNKPFYIYDDLLFPKEDIMDPVVVCRVNSEKYFLALAYLNCFLPKAGRLDDLVHMCQTLTFASLSQNFPQKSARARSNMHEYVMKWA